MDRKVEVIEDLRVVRYPHPALRYKSKPIRRVDSDFLALVDRMFELMYEERGIGLAANQVDLPYRFFIINLSGDPSQKDKEFVFINPEIISKKGNEEGPEGCLSLPDITAVVRRSAEIEISAYNLKGEEVQWRLKGLFARAFQHEYDHLDGTLFIDRLTPTRRWAVADQVDELASEYARRLIAGTEPK
ncbi:MAG: peptide deformylase, partial [Thermogutta sp.]|nr:peptide deformylase [Thermogutta sp.]